MSQNVYILLFRGINVGGNKPVRMDALKQALTHAGFGSVATYIQSGNVVLTSDQGVGAIAAKVEALFSETFGFGSRPTVRSVKEWEAVIDGNPFRAELTDGRQEHAVFLDAAPAPDAVDRLKGIASTEQMSLGTGVLYLYTPDGFGRSKVAEMLDRVLKVPLTARNWNTVLKLQEMAAKIAPA